MFSHVHPELLGAEKIASTDVAVFLEMAACRRIRFFPLETQLLIKSCSRLPP